MESLIPLAILLVAFYLLVVRPARTRQRAALELQAALAPGSEVMTGSGIYGRVTSVDDDVVGLEVAPGVAIRVAKPAIGRILPTETAGDPPEPDADRPV